MSFLAGGIGDFASGISGDGSGGAWSQEAAASGAGAAAGAVSGGEGSAEPPTVDAAFKLQVEEGATVSATFPFFGDPEGGQLSFQIGDHIEVRSILCYMGGGLAGVQQWGLRRWC